MDREKVIKGLTECVAAGLEKACSEDCPYFLQCFPDVGLLTPFVSLMADALALLKKQEAEWIYGEDETGVDGWHCSKCNFFEPWFYEYTDNIDFIAEYAYCPHCGSQMLSYTGKPTTAS